MFGAEPCDQWKGRLRFRPGRWRMRRYPHGRSSWCGQTLRVCPAARRCGHQSNHAEPGRDKRDGNNNNNNNNDNNNNKIVNNIALFPFYHVQKHFWICQFSYMKNNRKAEKWYSSQGVLMKSKPGWGVVSNVRCLKVDLHSVNGYISDTYWPISIEYQSRAGDYISYILLKSEVQPDIPKHFWNWQFLWNLSKA